MRHRESPNSGWTRVVFLSAIVFSCLLIIFNRGSVHVASEFETTTQDTVSPLVNLLAVPLRGIEDFFSSLNDRAEAFERNKALKDELAVLRDRQARYENLAMKVARYEAILGVDTETDVPLKKIAARAIGETNGPFVRSLLLNVGAKDGISIGNPVMSTEGLVGHVINIGSDTSRVLRLSDLNSRIAVASARSGATAILAGDNTPNPKLSFINQREDWAVGDLVISSGDDGALPRGLAVGAVVAGKAGDLRVILSSLKVSVDWVWVSPYQRVSVPSEETEEVN